MATTRQEGPARGANRRRVVVLAAAAAVLLTTVGLTLAVVSQGQTRGGTGSPGAGRTSPTHPAGPATTSRGPEVTTPATTTGGASPGSAQATDPGRTPRRLPPAGAEADYQLSQPYTPAPGVRIVARDRTAAPAPGLYTICYVNAFQTQAEANGWWRRAHPDLLLRRGGTEVTDPDWGEILLDISAPAKRSALLGIVGGWIDGCAEAGFDAVEADNLDTWTRSGGLLTRSHALTFAGALAARAHANGLAIAQKNAAELGAAGRTAGFDFAVAESCQEYTGADGRPECQGYADVYGGHVIVIEYDRTHFRRACAGFGRRLSVVLRDIDLTAPGSPGHLYDSC